LGLPNHAAHGSALASHSRSKLREKRGRRVGGPKLGAAPPRAPDPAATARKEREGRRSTKNGGEGESVKGSCSISVREPAELTITAAAAGMSARERGSVVIEGGKPGREGGECDGVV
jgi:hypothetical protein